MDAAGAIEKHVTQTETENTKKFGQLKKGGNMILPPPTAGRGELAPFLKPTNTAKKGITKINLLGEGRESSTRYGKGINVVCKIDNKKYIWTIRFDSPDRPSPNYRRLFERFGSDIKKWKGVVRV